MAFGAADTERLYEKAIRPVLGQRGIDPVRVDRLERNEDIDDQIVREIGNADFAIADLTYARPSVYYEAGFAEREIPVIYTIRRDHLRPRADDEFGAFRLHFDLQMKSVIDWTDPSDEVFRSRLGSRIDVVVGPLRDRAKADDQDRAERASFRSLPVKSQIDVIKKTASARCRRWVSSPCLTPGVSLDWKPCPAGSTVGTSTTS